MAALDEPRGGAGADAPAAAERVRARRAQEGGRAEARQVRARVHHQDTKR